jgi:hypothetical protein
VRAKPQWRDLPLQFASAKTVLSLIGAPPGWTSDWHCPCHDDRNPSFSAKPGREPGTTVVACGAGCTRAELLTYFRQRGYRLGPMRMAPPKKTKPKPGLTVATSVAFRVLKPSEQLMYNLIAAGHDPTYNDFVDAGVHRQAIPGGLRAMQALGLIGVRRSTRRKGCQRYEPNHYWTEIEWPWLEPSGSMKAQMKEALGE